VRDFTAPAADVTLVLETDRLSLPEIEALTDNWPASAALWFCGDARRVGGATPGQVFRDLWEHAALCLEVPASFVHPIAPALGRLFAEHPPAASARDLSGQVHVIYSPENEIAASARVLRDEVLASLGYDADDVLFVCPVRAGGVSVDTLNAQLGSHELRAGMPVLCERDVPGIAVRRGERGVLEAYSKRHGSARFGACAYPVGNGRGQVSSAYCVSAHRAGGSLARVVVLVLASSHGALLSREVVYSAASAAIERVLILAPREALARALTTSQPEHRGGWFAELLRVAP
jgi:ATP-dependent exoDNAse (exonuclease V) alpha subunit